MSNFSLIAWEFIGRMSLCLRPVGTIEKRVIMVTKYPYPEYTLYTNIRVNIPVLASVISTAQMLIYGIASSIKIIYNKIFEKKII